MVKAGIIFTFIALLSINSAFSASIKLPYITFGERPESKLETDKEKMSESRTTKQKERMQVEGIDLSQPLTLQQCIQIAVEKSPTMRSARLDLVQQNMNLEDAQSEYLPQIDISGGYSFSDRIDFGWEKENYDASLDASYTIWDHGRRKSALAQAKARMEAEYSRYTRTTQSLIFDVIQAYYDLLEAEKIIIVDEQLVEQSKQNVEKVKAFLEAGTVVEADVATARVQLANNELTLINDMNNLEIARANLAIILGFEPGTKISVVEDLDYDGYIKTGIIETEEISIEDIKAKALALRPEIKEAKANRDVLELAAKLAKLERWPQINAEGRYNLRLDDYLRERDALKNYKSWDVSARIFFPLFDGGRSARTVKKAEISLQKSDESMFELEQSISLEVRQAYFNFERTKKSLDIASAQVEDARMSLEIIQGRYDLGMVILLELLDAQTQYARARINQVKAFYNYKVARKSLEKAMGALK
ncbi:MAG: TolC family protein [bacterium]